ncbi:MAG: hypothetical protein EU531_09075 [Promethearchaeota archaeon]|nr:MAG: hypothetical protein EU531_09075 [Candidatus Lokiarchaeota archaeon]
MDAEQFELSKSFNYYDEFMEKVLEFDNLTMDDYAEFMPKVLPVILAKGEKDPILLFEEIIDDLKGIWTASEELPFHGPWHHGIAPAVVIMSLKNNGYDFTENDVKEAFIRGLKIPAGGCGFCGTCGAGSGLGIAISIVEQSTPFHDKERSKAFSAVIKANERIGKLGGPRCCRLSTYTMIDQSIKILADYEYHLPRQKLIGRCDVHSLNAQCHGNRCPYFPK